MRRVTTERIVLDKDEREIKKTWGRDWTSIWKDIKKHGQAAILTGTWSGYTSSQSRVCHSEYVRWDHADGMRLHNIFFTDGTTLYIEIRAYTIEQILEWKLRRINGYEELIREARGAMVESFYVGQDNAPAQVEHREPEPAPAVAPEPVAEIRNPILLGTAEVVKDEPSNVKSRAEKIKEEQMGKNWYDR